MNAAGVGGPRARLLDGATLARRLREDARAQVEALGGPPPSLRVILLGKNPASEAYVASKEKAVREAGLEVETLRLPPGTSPAALLSEVDRCNRDDRVDAILVQLPLGPGHDVREVFDALDPRKDVDAFHPENVGLLHQGRPRFVPCTPAGILALLEANAIPIAGRHAVILGRSEIVGKPLAALMTMRDATVTLCHSKTRDLAALCRQGEILVSAIGRPGFITPEFVAEGATVIDVGINRITRLADVPEPLQGSEAIVRTLERKGTALVGDVDFARVSQVAGAITPVPGGVGPLTVAMLLRNTVLAARLRRGEISLPPLPLGEGRGEG